jgi:hypothetical protein
MISHPVIGVIDTHLEPQFLDHDHQNVYTEMELRNRFQFARLDDDHSPYSLVILKKHCH